MSLTQTVSGAGDGVGPGRVSGIASLEAEQQQDCQHDITQPGDCHDGNPKAIEA
ncbi:MAG: hypothetical protein MZV65_01965 [Chromatiales bacterium]|nr:hypothetical protein [Chromatiales bacterium]